MPSEKGLEKEHALMLIALKRFHDVCMRNEIKYSLYAGTLLGAVREKGFIPWDDDIDVTMMRSEYDKFCKVMQSTNRKEEYVFLDSTFDRIPRFCICEKGVVISVDIFVYDYISERYWLQKLKIGFSHFGAAFTRTRENYATVQVRTQYAKWKHILYWFIYSFGLLFPVRLKCRMRDYFCANCLCGKRKLIYLAMDQYAGVKNLWSASVMEKYELILFENEPLMITKNYNEILTLIYGPEYMTPVKYDDNEFALHEIIKSFVEKQVKMSLLDSVEK